MIDFFIGYCAVMSIYLTLLGSFFAYIKMVKATVFVTSIGILHLLGFLVLIYILAPYL